MQTRIVFMGSPDFAIPTLKALDANYDVVGVITQPDRPAGRGRTLKPPPIKVLATELGLPVMQPRRLRDAEAMEQLQAWQPDVIVVAAFGQILRSAVLDMPAHGCINVHASLLPRWRGAAPIQAAILQGDEQTGVTIMRMDPGVDTGAMLSKRAIPIGPDDTAGTLSPRLARLGAKLLMETLPKYLSGELTPQPQNDSEATLAPMLKKTDGQLDYDKTAAELARQVRAYNPWPGSYMLWQDKPLKVHRARAVDVKDQQPGQFSIFEGLPAVGTADGLLVMEEVQPAGKKAMPGEAFLQGARTWGT